MRTMRTIGAVALVTLLVGCGGEVETKGDVLRSVKSVVVTAAGSRSRTFSGVSEAARELRISFKVAGTITDLPIQVGDRLAPGDLIAALDEAPFGLEADRAEAALIQARANERNANANYQRARDLYENGNASRTDLDAARAAAESASAQVRSAENSTELAKLNVSYARIEAEEDCSVASVGVAANENVGTTTPIATLNCGEGLDVRVNVPESLIGRLETGMPASIRFDALGAEVFDGRIVELGVAAVQNASSFPVTIRLNDAQSSALRAGMAAEATVQTDAASDRLTVPSTAVAKDHEGTFVYLVDEPAARVVRRSVVAGELTSTGVEVISGVAVGDRVVIAGVSKLRDGQAIALD